MLNDSGTFLSILGLTDPLILFRNGQSSEPLSDLVPLVLVALLAPRLGFYTRWDNGILIRIYVGSL